MSSVGRYLYTYMHHPIRQLPNNEQNSMVSLMNSVIVLDLEDPKKQEKLKKSSLKQANNAKAQHKYNLLEERLKAV